MKRYRNHLAPKRTEKLKELKINSNLLKRNIN